MQFLDKMTEPFYFLLRVMTGLLFVQHGTQKFFNFPKDGPGDLNAMMTGAASIELVGGLLVAVGLLTRPAAFICAGMSAVGYWFAHGLNDFYPINNGGTLIALYCFAFLFISAKGSGIWSVDGAIGKSSAE